MGGNQTEEKGNLYEFDMIGTDGGRHSVWAFWVRDFTSIALVNLSRIQQMFPDAPSPAFNKSYGEVDMLIGSNFYTLHPKPPENLWLLEKGTIKYKDGHLEEVANSFGWLVKGTNPKWQTGKQRSAFRNQVLYSKCMKPKVFFNRSRTGRMSSSRVSDLESMITSRLSDIMTRKSGGVVPFLHASRALLNE